MDKTLKQVRLELANTIAELTRIAQGIETNFTGIGEKDCALSLYNTIRLYQKKLNQIDTEISKRKFSSGGGTFGGESGGSHF